MEKEQTKLNKLNSSKERMEKEVNCQAMNQLNKTQEKYQDLMDKKTTVENDRRQILETIGTLDRLKEEAVSKAYVEVNQNFKSVFETLLPGATAELKPQPGKTVLQGLVFRVGFNGTWKENLSELSGGQRSLVALSLILGLLMLKPAPLYILDEIDSALDASHTANIGRMLAKHFQKSQFIVVSLKDGMFNNANVLYRTQFVNGVSSVSRHAKGEAGGPNANHIQPVQVANKNGGKKSASKKSNNNHGDSDKENNFSDVDEDINLANKQSRPAARKTKSGRVPRTRK